MADDKTFNEIGNETDNRMRSFLSRYVQSKLERSGTQTFKAGETQLSLAEGQDPKQAAEEFLKDTTNLDATLDTYFTQAYEQVKKHSGVTYDQFVARASDSIANNAFAFDRPTNTSNLLLADRIGDGVGAGKPVEIKGKTAETGAASGLIPVDQSKSKLANRGKTYEFKEYNKKNKEQLGEDGVAVATHLTYEDGRKWYSDSHRNEYYELDGQLYKSVGGPDKYNIDTDPKIDLKNPDNSNIQPLMVMGDKAKGGEPYKGDIDHGMNAMSKQYYEKGKKEIKPQWVNTSGEEVKKGDKVYGGSTQEQLAFATAEMADEKLDTMIRHSSENFFNLSNHGIIQEDLIQGMQLMMPDGSTTIIHADLDEQKVGFLDPETLEMNYKHSNDPALDAEKMFAEYISKASKDHAAFPNPRWGWEVDENGNFSVPNDRVNFKDLEIGQCSLKARIKDAENELIIRDDDDKIIGDLRTKNPDELSDKEKNDLAFYNDQKDQLSTLENVNNLYSSIMAYQFNQAIFDGKSDYQDEIAGVVIDKEHYQEAITGLQNLNKEFCEKRSAFSNKFEMNYSENEINSSLFAGREEQLVDKLRNFNLEKQEEKELQTPAVENATTKVSNENEAESASTANTPDNDNKKEVSPKPMSDNLYVPISKPIPKPIDKKQDALKGLINSIKDAELPTTQDGLQASNPTNMKDIGSKATARSA